MGLDVNWAVKWLTLSRPGNGGEPGGLIELDRAIGDSDHGENMDRGFQAVLDKLAETPPETPGRGAQADGHGADVQGGRRGRSALRHGVPARRHRTRGRRVHRCRGAGCGACCAARDGIVARGKAESGDKTMVDAWTPAVEAAAAAAADGDTLAVLMAAAEAAEAGAVATDPLVARKGRASYLGERSAGHRDPGAASSALILRAAAGAAA